MTPAQKIILRSLANTINEAKESRRIWAPKVDDIVCSDEMWNEVLEIATGFGPEAVAFLKSRF